MNKWFLQMIFFRIFLDLPLPINQSQIVYWYKYKSRHFADMLRPSKLIIIIWDKSKKNELIAGNSKRHEKSFRQVNERGKRRHVLRLHPSNSLLRIEDRRLGTFHSPASMMPKDISNHLKSSCIFYCVHSFILSFLTTPYILGTCSFISILRLLFN